MSALANRPEDNNNDNNKSNIPSFASKDKVELPLEKQLTHRMFVNNIQSISLDDAKQLLEELHMLYLSQQYLMVKIAKQEFLGNM